WSSDVCSSDLHHLAGVRIQSAGDRVDTEFWQQRVATGGVCGGRARAASEQALGAAGDGLAVASDKGGRTAGGEAAAQQPAAFGVRCGGFLLVCHDVSL